MRWPHLFVCVETKHSIELIVLFVLWRNTMVVVTIDTVGLTISHFWSVLCYCHYSIVLLPLQYCVTATTVLVNTQTGKKRNTRFKISTLGQTRHSRQAHIPINSHLLHVVEAPLSVTFSELFWSQGHQAHDVIPTGQLVSLYRLINVDRKRHFECWLQEQSLW
jgi:hypothetical protein